MKIRKMYLHHYLTASNSSDRGKIKTMDDIEILKHKFKEKGKWNWKFYF